MSWIARLSTNCQEIRLLYHPHKACSAGARSFLDLNYVQIKRLNPRLPFTVRPYTNELQTPTLIARFDYGAEHSRDLTNMTEEEVKEQLKFLNELGGHAIKADLYSWQESSKGDVDVVDYDPNEFEFHHV